MLDQFRKKLKEEGRSLSWFHSKYLNGALTYTYLAQQIGGFSPVNEAVEKAIQKYLNHEKQS